jgi:hypothetical protein
VRDVGRRRTTLLAVGLVLVASPLAVSYLDAGPPMVSETQPPWAEEYYSELSSSVETYNERANDLYEITIWGLDLARLEGPVSGERVNIYITDEFGRTAVFSFRVTEQTRLVELAPRARTDATVRVLTDRVTVERLDDEYTKTRAAKRAYLDGNITVEGVGPANRAKWWAIQEWVELTLRDGVTVLAPSSAVDVDHERGVDRP